MAAAGRRAVTTEGPHPETSELVAGEPAYRPPA
jgi:hypothetical protein